MFILFAVKYGRRPIYLASTATQMAMSIWLACMQTTTDLMLTNIFSNMVGALAEVMVQMPVADTYFVHQRGLMNSIYAFMMNTGTCLGPVAAGYVTVSQGWRWAWWWIDLFFGVRLLGFFFLYEETKFLPVTTGDPIATTPDRAAAAQTLPEKPNLESMLTAVSIDTSIPEKTYRQKLSLWSTSPTSLSELTRHIYQPVAFFLLTF